MGKMLIAVTGGMGFIGQEVVSSLLERGHRVVVVDYWSRLITLYESEKFPILEESVYRTLSACEAVLTPPEFIRWLGDSREIDAIVHLGAVVDTTDMGSDSLFSDNVEFTRLLVAAANTSRPTWAVPGVVFASSAAAYGARGYPNNPYGLTKALGERILAQLRGEYSAVRLFNVFGRNEHHKGKMASVPFKIAQAYQRGARFELHSPEAARDFVPVTTVAAKLCALADLLGSRSQEEPQIRETVDLGTGYATTFSDLDTFIMQATRNQASCVKIVPMPTSLEGRYQPYTCAGVRIRNIGVDSIGTRPAIEETYGTR